MHRWLASFLALLFSVGAVIVPSLHRHVPESCVEQRCAVTDVALSAGCDGHAEVIPEGEPRNRGGGISRPASHGPALLASESVQAWRAVPSGHCSICLIAKLPMLGAEPQVALAPDGVVPSLLLDAYEIPALVRGRRAAAPRGPPTSC